MSHPNNEPALVRSTSDPEQVKHAREVELRAKDHEDADLKAVLNTYPGRAVAFRWLLRCGVESDTFAGERNRTDYLVGRQSFGLELQREIKRVSLESYLLMLREAEQRKQRRVDPKRKRRNLPSGEPAKPVLVETEDTIESIEPVEDADGN